MQLAAFLRQSDTSIAAFGAQVGVSKQTMHRYVHGLRWPPADVMQRIASVTEGRVTALDFVDQHAPAPRPVAA